MVQMFVDHLALALKKNIMLSAMLVTQIMCTKHRIANYCTNNSLRQKTGFWHSLDRGADKSLDRPERKQAAPVKSMMGRGMDCFG